MSLIPHSIFYSDMRYQYFTAGNYLQEFNIREITRQGETWYVLPDISPREIPAASTQILSRFNKQKEEIRRRMSRTDKNLLRCRVRYLFLVGRIDRIRQKAKFIWKSSFYLYHLMRQAKYIICLKYKAARQEETRIKRQLQHFESIENIDLHRYVKIQAAEKKLRDVSEYLFDYWEQNPLTEE